jgi:DHA2 family multidrug resistance protein
VGFTDQTSPQTIVVASVTQGFGLGLVFVPLSTVAFTSLPAHLRPEGTAILTLVRNIGSSIGISMVIAQVTTSTARMHANLVEHITPFNDALRAPDVSSILNLTTDAGRALLDLLATQQATIIAYGNVFKLLMYLTLATLPFLILFGSARSVQSLSDGSEAHAFE